MHTRPMPINFDPTFDISVFNFGAIPTRPATLRADLMAVVLDLETDDPHDVSFSSISTVDSPIMPIDPKGEPLQFKTTYANETLEEKPELTWRDVKDVLANTTRRIDAYIGAVDLRVGVSPRTVQLPWTENAAGYSLHNWYGFGAVAVDAALEFIEAYEPNLLGDFHGSAWFEQSETLDISDDDIEGISQTQNVRGLVGDANIETAVLEIDWQHEFPNDLGVHLISPEGTRSVIGQVFDEALDVKGLGTFSWRMLSNALYGKNPNADWGLEVFDADANDVGRVALAFLLRDSSVRTP